MSSDLYNDIDKLSSRQKILFAATEVIAEKGYDAASVGEIAKKASVTKPTIYYYFDSKSSILEELIKTYLKEIAEEKEAYADRVEKLTKEELNVRLDKKVKQLSKNKKVLKIIAMETLKGNSTSDTILKLLNAMFKAGYSKIKEKGLGGSDEKDIAIGNFFFATIPTFMLMLLDEKFCQLYQIDIEDLYVRFFDIMKSTYIDHFVKISTSK